MLILTVLTGWAGVAALAQEPPPVEGAPEMPRLEGRITGRVKQHVPKPRSDAPIPVEIELDYNSDKILRGELELELMYGSSTIARVRSPEVVITRDKRVERFTLPPFETYGLEDWAVLRMTLDTGDKRIQIDGQQVSAPTTSQRQLGRDRAGSEPTAPSWATRSATSQRKRDTAAESSAVRPGASPSQNGMLGGWPRASSTRTRPGSTRRMSHDVLPSWKMSPGMLSMAKSSFTVPMKVPAGSCTTW